MQWEAIGALGEVAGAVGVIITLMYLSVQIRQNSRMMKANTKQAISDASQGIIYKMIDEAAVAEKLFDGNADLDPIEHRKAWLLARAMLRGYEAQIYQHEVGLLDDSEWRYLRRTILETTNIPGFRALWPELSGSVSDSLRKIVEDERRRTSE